MLKIFRTDATNPHFISLVEKLDAYLKITDGEEHAFYNQFNGIEALDHIVVAYSEKIPVGCGAIKRFDTMRAEVKRMYTIEKYRGKGVASDILNNLESWAKELGYTYTILETGKRQIEAVNFYKKCNYKRIPNYGQYKTMDNSLCFEKQIN
jgi:GNAT superfamily N-acetyltransferase